MANCDVALAVALWLLLEGIGTGSDGTGGAG